MASTHSESVLSAQPATAEASIASTVTHTPASIASTVTNTPIQSTENHEIAIQPTPSLHISKRLSPAWEICEGCAQPESAYFNPSNSTIYVSNVNGEPSKKDGLGSISKFSTDGKLIKKDFVIGLNAPKGMRSANGKLYVADIDQVLVINEKSGKIERKIAFKGAQFLNDIAFDKRGNLYVSDTEGSAIYTWSARSGVKTLASGKHLECPNGLLVVGNSLIIASWGVMAPDWSTKVPGKLMAYDLKTEEMKVFTKKPIGNLDGLEKIDEDHFIVSDWVAGKVFIVSTSGEFEEILSGMKGSADLGWIPSKRLILVPRMNENLISAFRLK